jgi:hypothetical protein
VTAEPNELFDDWAARLARGESPDPLAYLDRAGDAREELAHLMDTYLQSVPRREPDPETLELARAWVAGASPLAELRARRGLRRQEVVDAVVGEFALDPAKAPIVKRYYHELEAGILDPSRLSRALLDLLSAKLGVARETILAWRARPLDTAPAFRVDGHAPVPASPRTASEDDEQVRDLFLSGR